MAASFEAMHGWDTARIKVSESEESALFKSSEIKSLTPAVLASTEISHGDQRDLREVSRVPPVVPHGKGCVCRRVRSITRLNQRDLSTCLLNSAVDANVLRVMTRLGWLKCVGICATEALASSDRKVAEQSGIVRPMRVLKVIFIVATLVCIQELSRSWR